MELLDQELEWDVEPAPFSNTLRFVMDDSI